MGTSWSRDPLGFQHRRLQSPAIVTAVTIFIVEGLEEKEIVYATFYHGDGVVSVQV
jgi:hypothetical protein